MASPTVQHQTSLENTLLSSAKPTTSTKTQSPSLGIGSSSLTSSSKWLTATKSESVSTAVKSNGSSRVLKASGSTLIANKSNSSSTRLTSLRSSNITGQTRSLVSSSTSSSTGPSSLITKTSSTTSHSPHSSSLKFHSSSSSQKASLSSGFLLSGLKRKDLTSQGLSTHKKPAASTAPSHGYSSGGDANTKKTMSSSLGGGTGKTVSASLLSNRLRSTQLSQSSLLPSSSLLSKKHTHGSSTMLPATPSFGGRSLLAGKTQLSSSITMTAVTTTMKSDAHKRNGVAQTTPTTDQPITEMTDGAPMYNFTKRGAFEAEPPREPKFLPPELDANVQGPPMPLSDMTRLKTTLINSVATSLLCNPDFRSSSDQTRRSLLKLGEKLARSDPEFILKAALYTRCDLNIRTTGNFLLALAANLHTCRPHLRKYFCSSIRIPSDWIEVAEIYQAFHDKALNFGSLPTALRKVMGSKFVEFDEYQLGKYNKDSSKKKKKKTSKNDGRKPNDAGKGKGGKGEGGKGEGGKGEGGKGEGGKGEEEKSKELPSQVSKTSVSSDDEDSVVGASDSETEEEVERLSFTLKQLIRKIHISEPVEPVMCLLGKRYPDDPESFRRSRLPGIWNQDRAGKRMKLKTPETWETQVSLKGNKATTWQDLIDHNKLPFMAMLRNLRNLLIAGVSEKHHRWVLSKLNNERAVVNSRQFPFRFFSAFEVLSELEKITKGEVTQFQGRGKGKGKPGKTPKELPKVDLGILKRYRSALDNALKIATCYNVKPISGSTVILCNVGENMERPCTSARGLGKPRTVLEVGILLGLMCKYSCEDCTLLLYGEKSFTHVQLKDGTILYNMEQVMDTARSTELTMGAGVIPSQYLYSLLVERKAVDNLVLLTDAMQLDNPQGRNTMDFLKKYRQLVNSNLLFVSVDLSGRSSGVSSTIKPEHENDIYLAGYSDQILRFIAERGDSGQLTYVDNIDKVYNLKEVKQPALLPTDSTSMPRPSFLGVERALMASTQRQKWRTVRIFISSTFRDMHGERDLLTRFVFPELRARARSKQIQLYEVDLRWGVTEEDARHHRALEICLEEISRCQYFLGLLGERYGWVQEKYDVSDSPEFDWLKEYPTGRSITEVEMQHASLCNPDKAQGKSFFYFRDPSVIPEVPPKYSCHFESESAESHDKILRLKSEIRCSGLEVYDGYPSQWLGVLEGKPMVGELEDFGQRVIHNIWNAIKRDYPDEETSLDEVAEATEAHNAFADSCASSFVGRKSLLIKAQQLIESGEHRLVVLHGKPGSGKSAFVAALSRLCSESCGSPKLILSHFLGAAPSSTNLASILNRLCQEVVRRFHLASDVPEEITELVKSWPEFLEDSAKVAGVGSRLVIFLDGLDLLEEQHNARSMDWLPADLPQEVVVVMSVVENGPIHSQLRKRQPDPVEVMIGTLNEWDKGEMVRRTLAKHRKALDESAFNNQLKLLLSKRDATNPLFLHLACEELRVFGVFEEVTSFLKKMPPILPNLLQEILTRMEGELGKDTIATALSLLCLVRNGLREVELAGVLSLYFIQNSAAGGAQTHLPPMVVARLLRCLQEFLQPTTQEQSDLLSLGHRDVEKAVRSRYMKGTVESEKKCHRLLAEFFKGEADPSQNGSFNGNDVRAFDELPFHLMSAGAMKELESVVCNMHFVMAKCQLGSAHKLLEDYSPIVAGLPPARAREVLKFTSQPRTLTFKSFISRNIHVLTTTPTLSLQQAINESSSSPIAQEAAVILQENPQPLVKWVNRPMEGNPCRMTIPGHTTAVTCVAVSQDGSLFAAGFNNCSLKLYNTTTGKEIQSFIGHAATITSLCFVGSHAICSGSHDTNLSLWDLKEGFRIATLKEHTRSVRGCAANAAGKVLVSVSWDASTKVWDGHSGKVICTLKSGGTSNCPLNCVAFHPEGQLIAVGGWDKALKIWDTLNRKKIKSLKGHKTSIQACAYAPSGRHVVSASLDGEVKVWSTKSGSAVGSITGHSSPVNDLTFTPNGQFLVTGSSDQLVKVWSGSLGQRTALLGKPENGYAHCMAYHRTSQTVVVGYHDGHTRKFSIPTRVELFAVKLHDAPVLGVGCQGQFHMSASADGSIKVWESPQSLPQHMLLEGHKAPISCAVWCRQGFASAAEDFSLLLWPHEPSYYTRLLKQNKNKATTISVYPLVSLKGHTAIISSIAFSHDGTRMASASRDQSVTIWDVLCKKEVCTLRNCHKDWINTCAFSDTNANMLITGSNDFNLKLWDVKTQKERITFKGHTSSINSVAFSQGCVVSGAFDGSVKVWTHKGVEITTLYCHQQRVNACLIDVPNKGFSESQNWAEMMSEEEEGSESKSNLDSIQVLTASDDGTVGIWKPFVPNEISSLVGHSDRVLSVATTINNEIVTSSQDKAIRIWSPKLTDTVSLASQVKGHTGEVTSCTMSSDGKLIATSGRDGCFTVWVVEKEGVAGLCSLYQVKASEKALTSLCFTPTSRRSGCYSLAVGRDDGCVGLYTFSNTTYPVESQTLGANSLMKEHPVSQLTTSPDGAHLLVASWCNEVAMVNNRLRLSERMTLHTDWATDVVTAQEDEQVGYSIGLDNSLCRWQLGSERRSKSGSKSVRMPVSMVNATKYNILTEKHGRLDPWLLSLCVLGRTHLAIGDSEGNVTFWSRETKRVELVKRLHQRAVNKVAAVRGDLVTASDDGTVKIWKVGSGRGLSVVQVGHFYCQSRVTALATPTSTQGPDATPLLVTGDCLGHVTLLEWHRD